ncbi:MAG: hypothetical protein M3O30_19110 [Planctomycetota bacterium]|nr:hypothetical protein [Planctomycetota bacterium]
MLLQTNSYIVPRDKRMEHARLLRRFRQTLMRLGCDHFEVYEQVGANWNTGETTGRFVQIMRFRDRKHQLGVQSAERSDPVAQALVREFCELINFPYQQQQGLFAVGFYTGFLRMPPQRTTTALPTEGEQGTDAAAEAAAYAGTGPDFVEQPIDDAAAPMSMSGDVAHQTEVTDANGEYSEVIAVQEGGEAAESIDESIGAVDMNDPASYIVDDSETEFSVVEDDQAVPPAAGNGSPHVGEIAVPDASADEPMTSDELREAAEAIFGPSEENGQAVDVLAEEEETQPDHAPRAQRSPQRPG